MGLYLVCCPVLCEKIKEQSGEKGGGGREEEKGGGEGRRRREEQEERVDIIESFTALILVKCCRAFAMLARSGCA